MSIEQPKLPEELKNFEPNKEIPPVTESPRKPPENLNESAESQKENQERAVNQEKNLKLEEIRHEVENIGDRIGRPIDEGIRETVVMFKANELPTSDSCEGHAERGLPVPYVEVSAPDEPLERFIGQNEAFEKVAKKYNITSEEAKTSKIDEAYWEAMKECSQNEETEEYQKWNKENEKLLAKGHNLLEEFYKDRKVEPNVKLQIEEGVETYRIHNGGEDYQPVIEEEREFTEEEKKVRSEKVEKYRSEMKEFTEFLKEKYFEEHLAIRKLISEEDSVEAIKTEDAEEKLNYFEIAKKVEGLEQKKAEMIWYEIGRKFKEIGVFSNLEQEGIDIFKPEKEWKSPYEIKNLSNEKVKERLGSNFGNIGGYYEEGKVFISEDERIPNATKDSIAFVAAGYGLGRKAETLIHETYHGFQDVAPEELRKYEIKKTELEDKMKAVELESKITGKPAYDLTHLRYQKEKLEEELRAKTSHPELDSEEKIIDRHILMEIYAHMFADPLKYAREIKSYDKDAIVDTYFTFPVKKVYEDIIGVRRESEDKDRIYRYDYMKGKNEQAFVAFRQIEALRTLGLNNLEIGQIIAKDEYDLEKGQYKKMREKIRETRENRGITPEKLNEMIEKFRLETIYKSLKAQNLAKDIIKKYI